ncbi:hypothetical protein Pcinc_022068 [Petrolisthes cinctipes]|uniref:Uncharacterized protein n=1 Tax=Petrolisthes cinctipes TaxID=88211 RepID=A0AAE1KE83_PETCI|nr:hypothetical protein Pcinc_022068 [Petrolisthes cinctipes]
MFQSLFYKKSKFYMRLHYLQEEEVVVEAEESSTPFPNPLPALPSPTPYQHSLPQPPTSTPFPNPLPALPSPTPYQHSLPQPPTSIPFPNPLSQFRLPPFPSQPPNTIPLPTPYHHSPPLHTLAHDSVHLTQVNVVLVVVVRSMGLFQALESGPVTINIGSNYKAGLVWALQ